MMKQFLIFISIVVVLFACEKVIEVPLNEADQKIVIEGNLYDYPGNSFVKLSKTGSVYDDTGFEKLSGATVIIEDDQGNVNQFMEDSNEPGLYRDTLFEAVENRVYNLKVYVENDTFSAESTAKSPGSIDSLWYKTQNGSFGFGTDTTYLVFYKFSDDISQENYYRIVPFINGVRSGFIYLQDDDLFNGKNVAAPFFAESIEAGDSIFVELQSMDKGTFKYFNTLSDADGGTFAPTPANPVSNIQGGALGYFGVYTTDQDAIVIPQ